MARVDDIAQGIIQGKQKNYGILDQIGAGLLAPITKMANVAAESTSARGANANPFTDDSYKPKYMEQNELDQYRANPLGKGLQDAFGAASYAIPIPGGSLARTVLGAAALGGGQALAQQDLRKGIDAGEVAKGALLGGGIAGIGKVAGDAVSKFIGKGSQKAVEEVADVADNIKPAGAAYKYAEDEVNALGDALTGSLEGKNRLQKGGIIEDARSSGVQAQKGANSIDDFYKTAANLEEGKKFFGIKKSGPEGAYELAQKVKDLTNRVAEESDMPIVTGNLRSKEVIQDFANQYGLSEAEATKALEDVANKYKLIKPGETIAQNTPEGTIMSSTYEPINVKDALDAKRKLFAQADAVTENALNNGTKNFNANQLAQKYIYDHLKGQIDQIPGVAKLNQTAARLISNEPGMLNAFNRGIAENTASVNIPTMIANKLKSKSGQAQKLVGDLLAGEASIPGLPSIPGASQVAETVAPAVAPITNTINSPYGRTAATSILNQIGAQQDEAMPPAQSVSGQVSPASPTSYKETPYQIASSFQQPETEYDSILNLIHQGVDLKTAQNILGQMGGGAQQKPASAGDRKLKSITNSGLKALDDIESISTSDNAALLTGNLPSFVQSSNARKLNTAITQAADSLGRLRSGGAISKQEEERFRELLPTWSDDAETKQYKLNSLRQIFQDAGGENA